MSRTVHPLTAARFPDFAAVVNPRGNPRHCWCLAYRLTGAQVRELETDPDTSREATMRALAAGDPAPGLVAYRDDEPVGWVGAGPRSTIPRLARSSVIPHVDDRPVWSVFCLVVRAGHRRQGVTGQLLDGVERYASERGAPALEAYPVEPPPDRRVNSAFAYVGTTSMFERAGFVRVCETSSTSDGLVRWLMRKELSASP